MTLKVKAPVILFRVCQKLSSTVINLLPEICSSSKVKCDPCLRLSSTSFFPSHLIIVDVFRVVTTDVVSATYSPKANNRDYQLQRIKISQNKCSTLSLPNSLRKLAPYCLQGRYTPMPLMSNSTEWTMTLSLASTSGQRRSNQDSSRSCPQDSWGMLN